MRFLPDGVEVCPTCEGKGRRLACDSRVEIRCEDCDGRGHSPKPKPRVITVTTCSTCPFDVSDDSSWDRDHCTLLGSRHEASAGGFRVPPEECPLRTGVEFVLDVAEAKRVYGEWYERQKAEHEKMVRQLKEEESLLNHLPEELHQFYKEARKVRGHDAARLVQAGKPCYYVLRCKVEPMPGETVGDAIERVRGRVESRRAKEERVVAAGGRRHCIAVIDGVRHASCFRGDETVSVEVPDGQDPIDVLVAALRKARGD